MTSSLCVPNYAESLSASDVVVSVLARRVGLALVPSPIVQVELKRATPLSLLRPRCNAMDAKPKRDVRVQTVDPGAT